MAQGEDHDIRLKEEGLHILLGGSNEYREKLVLVKKLCPTMRLVSSRPGCEARNTGNFFLTRVRLSNWPSRNEGTFGIRPLDFGLQM
jgi:hypothetical protein